MCSSADKEEMNTNQHDIGQILANEDYEVINFNLTNIDNNIIEFKSFGYNFTMKLNHNNNLYSSPNNVHHMNDCYYHGHVKQDTSSLISLSMCNNRGIRANIIAFGNTFIIKPFKYYINTSQPDQYDFSENHIIHRYQINDRNKEIYSKYTRNKHRRQLLNVPSRVVEMLMINDKKRVEAFQSTYSTKWYEELTASTLEVVNFVSALYLSTVWDVTVGIISLRVKEIQNWNDYSNVQPVADSGNSAEADSTQYLLDLTTWLTANVPQSNYDNVALLTGENLEGVVGGRAHGSSMCKASDSCSVTQHYLFSEFKTGFTVAHEMGHNFGMSHTSSGVMSEGKDYLTPYFSDFSKAELKTFFSANDISCLDNFNEADYYPVPMCDITISDVTQVTHEGTTYLDPNGNYRLMDDFNGKPYYKQDKDTFLWYDGSEYRITNSLGGGGAPMARCQQNDISLCTTGNWEYWIATAPGYEIDSDAQLTLCNTITPQPTTPTSDPIPAPTQSPIKVPTGAPIGQGSFVTIISDNMADCDLPNWTIINPNDVNKCHSTNCLSSSGVCTKIAEKSAIYRTFSTVGYSSIELKYDINIGPLSTLEDGDNIYVYYSCSSHVTRVLATYSGKNSNQQQTFNLANDCANTNDLTLYFRSDTSSTNDNEEGLISDIVLYGIIDSNPMSPSKHNIFYDAMNDYQINWVKNGETVNIISTLSAANECISGPGCTGLNIDGQITSKNGIISTVGYDQISLHFDFHIDNALDTNEQFIVYYSCDGSTPLNIALQYDETDTTSINAFFAEFIFPLECNNINNLQLSFKIGASGSENVYLSNVNILAEAAASNSTPTPTSITTSPTDSTPTPTSITTSPTDSTPSPSAPSHGPIPGIYSIEGGIKLSDGTGSILDEIYKGRVEIYHNGEWGTICNDEADGEDFVVICKQLGYSTVDAYWATNYGTPFGEGMGSIWLNELACIGTETEVIQCNHDGWSIENCDHYEDISVSCKDPINPLTQNGDIRLSDGSGSVGDTIYEGRVEIYYDDIWGTICNDAVDIAEFDVICRQLGYSRVATYSNSGGDTPFGEGIGLIWLDQLACTGSETAIINCGHDAWGTHNCEHDEDISVSCTDPITTASPTDVTSSPTSPTPNPTLITPSPINKGCDFTIDEYLDKCYCGVVNIVSAKNNGITAINNKHDNKNIMNELISFRKEYTANIQHMTMIMYIMMVILFVFFTIIICIMAYLYNNNLLQPKRYRKNYNFDTDDIQDESERNALKR